MSVESSRRSSSSEALQLRAAISEKDAVIASTIERIADAARQQAESHAVVTALAAQTAKTDEKLDEAKREIERTRGELRQLMQGEKENRKTENRVMRAITGIFVVGLLTTGVVICVLRYA